MKCPNCGAEAADGSSFCTNCGTRFEKAVSPDRNPAAVQQPSYQQPYQQPSNQQPNSSGFPENYKPISMWGYFGYQVLFAIPIVGLIFLLVYSFGGTKNKNVQNFARSYFCFLIIVLIIIVIVAVTGGLTYFLHR